ncbi:MAG: hypothetical protein ACFFD7_08625 [Candidatus Thorarchaeota archaeon]
MGSVEFYIAFFVYNLILCAVFTLYYIFRASRPNMMKFYFLIRALLISSLTIWVLDGIPRIFMEIDDIPIFYINMGIIYMFLVLYLIIFSELSRYKPKKKEKPK